MVALPWLESLSCASAESGTARITALVIEFFEFFEFIILTTLCHR
jgi:hypothetical protein